MVRWLVCTWPLDRPIGHVWGRDAREASRAARAIWPQGGLFLRRCTEGEAAP